MRIGVPLALMALLASVEAGQALPGSATAPAPTTRPATGPSLPTTRPVIVEATTPKECLRLLNLALRDGDADAVRALFDGGNAQGNRLVSAMADYAAALANLHRSAVQAFGPEGANQVTGDMAAQSADGLAALEKAEAQTDGDIALVKYTGATDPPVRLIKVDGKWRLPLSQLLYGADSAAQEKRRMELADQTRLANDTAAEIAAGKFHDANKAAEVWRSRLLEAVAPRPATRPAPAEPRRE